MKKNIYYLIFSMMLFSITSCVDDYDEANPALLLDSPAFTSSTEADTVTGGEVVTISISIVDAPGLIDSAAVISTDNLGSFEINGFNELIGKTEGSFTVSFTTPKNFEGDFDVTVQVFDAQINDEGEASPQFFSETFTLYIEFGIPAASYSLEFLDPAIYQGSENDFTLTIETEGGIDSINVFSSLGEVQLDQNSVNAAKGKTSATVSGKFIAPEKYSGEVDFTIVISDVIQERLITEVETIEVGFEFDAPAFEITGVKEMLLGDEGTFVINVTSAMGEIDTVIVEALKQGTDETVGTLTIDVDSFNALEGKSSGAASFDFSSATFVGYISFKVTVIDKQGATTTNTFLLLVQACEFELAGSYSTLSSGTSTDGCPTNNPISNYASTVNITKVEGDVYQIDDFFAGVYIEWYDACYGYNFKTAGKFKVACSKVEVIPFSEGFDSEVTGSGTYDPETGTIEITWKNGFGDTATTTFTPQ